MGWHSNRQQKYNANRASFNGKVYHSQMERDDAMWLAQLAKEGTIIDLQEQQRYRIFHNGDHICDSIVDFKFIHEGVTVWYETKGLETDKYKVVKKLLLADMKTIPNAVYIVNAKDLMDYIRGRVSHA